MQRDTRILPESSTGSYVCFLEIRVVHDTLLCDTLLCLSAANVLRMSVYLRRWNAMALRVRDCQNRTATELAAENGHTAIAEELNRLEARRQDERLFLRPASPSPRRPSQDSGLDLALC